MRVIVCGAGQVGSTIARHLATEGIDVTVIDSSPEQAQRADESYDVRGMTGHASHPEVLERAGARGADMLIAPGSVTLDTSYRFATPRAGRTSCGRVASSARAACSSPCRSAQTLVKSRMGAMGWSSITKRIASCSAFSRRSSSISAIAACRRRSNSGLE